MHIEDKIQSVPDAELGAFLKEYLRESNHQGWDGFSSRDLTGIRRFIEDFTIGLEARRGE